MPRDDRLDAPVAAEPVRNARSSMSNAGSTQWRTLYEQLSSALQASHNDGYDDLHSRRAHRQHEISSARGAVNAALADAVEAWNIAHPDALQRLPTELAHEMFRELDFRDRIAVSHVSRGWRATALADPFLWNSGKFVPQCLPVYYPRPGGRPGDPPPKRPQKRSQSPPRKNILCELLARSEPVPFSFSWENELLPEDILDVVLRNMHRMQTLVVDPSWDGFRRFFAVPAPQLLSLTCTGESDTLYVPTHWDAPVLQTLKLGSARVLPGGDPPVRLASVRRLDCFEMHGLDARGVSLFDIFPALTLLDITIFWPEMVPYLSHPPATLSKLTLMTNDSPPIDYTPLLEGCRTCSLKFLYLDSVEKLAPVFALFTSTVAGTWTLDIHRTGYRVGLAAADGEASFVASPEAPLSFAREPRLAAHLSRVSVLSAPVHVLAELDKLEHWDRSLPALRKLTISCTQTADWPPSALPPIRAPDLESVAVAVFGGAPPPTAAAWVSEGLPTVLRSRFVYARPLLASISIESEVAESLAGQDLAGVRALSEVILVEPGPRSRRSRRIDADNRSPVE